MEGDAATGAEGRFSAPGSPVRADAGGDSGGERDSVRRPSAGVTDGVSSGKSVVTGKSATGDESDEVVRDWGLCPGSRNRDFGRAVWSWIPWALLVKGVLPPGEPARGTTGSLSGRRGVRPTGFTPTGFTGAGDVGGEGFEGGVEKASSVRCTTCSTDLWERVEEDEDGETPRRRGRGGEIMRSVRSV